MTERLRKENKKFQEIKKNFDEVKRDYEKKKNECDRMISCAESNAKRARLTEIMEQCKVILWSPSYKYLYKKKCNKCDNYRQVKVKLPSGNEVNDTCSCRVSKRVSYTQMYILYELKGNYSKITAWYKMYGQKGDEYFIIDSACRVPKLIIDHNISFDDIPIDNTVFFTTKEECQSYCDWLDPNIKEQGFIYNIDGSPAESEDNDGKE